MNSQKLLVSGACLFSLLCSIPLYALYHNCLIHFLVDRHISCFQFESFYEYSYACLYTHIFGISRNEVARSKNKTVFFQSVCTNLYSYQLCMWFPVAPHHRACDTVSLLRCLKGKERKKENLAWYKSFFWSLRSHFQSKEDPRNKK